MKAFYKEITQTTHNNVCESQIYIYSARPPASVLMDGLCETNSAHDGETSYPCNNRVTGSRMSLHLVALDSSITYRCDCELTPK